MPSGNSTDGQARNTRASPGRPSQNMTLDQAPNGFDAATSAVHDQYTVRLLPLQAHRPCTRTTHSRMRGLRIRPREAIAEVRPIQLEPMRLEVIATTERMALTT